MESKLYDHDCSRCALCTSVTTVCVAGRGSLDSDIMLVGEAPGRFEDQEGRPFVGSAGKLLSRALKQSGLDEGEVYITNVVKCRPPDNRQPTMMEVKECVDYLWNEVASVRPKVIVAMGKLASLVLTGKDHKMVTMRGRPVVEEFGTGEDEEGKEGVLPITVIPTWHPSYVNRSGSIRAEAELINDLTLARSMVYGEGRGDTDYRLINDPEELKEWVDEILKLHEAQQLPYGVVACDIETNEIIVSGGEDPHPFAPNTNIVSIQFSWGPGKAVFIPVIMKESVFNNDIEIKVLVAQLRRLFDEVPIVGHNFSYDAKYLWSKLGIFPKQVVFDTMLAHHCLWGGSLPNNLEFLTGRYLGWIPHKVALKRELEKLPTDQRHFGNVPSDVLIKYGCEDADATIQLYPVIRDLLKERRFQGSIYPTLLDTFYALYMGDKWRAVVSMEISGSKVDRGVLESIDEKLSGEIAEKLRVLRASQWVRVWMERNKRENPKRKKAKKRCKYQIHCEMCGYDLYVDPPKPVKNLRCRECGTDRVKVSRRMVPTGETMVDEAQPEYVYREFNPRSWKQVVELWYDIMKLPEPPEVGRSSNKEAVQWLLDYCTREGLSNHIDVIDSIVECNKLAKLHSDWVVGLRAKIDVQKEEDQVSSEVTRLVEPRKPLWTYHPLFKQHGTVTGRLSAGFHTIPKKSIIESVFVSRFDDGFILAPDYSQLEVRLFVVETGDPNLAAVFSRGEDPHAYMASRSFKVPLEKVTHEQRQAAKTIIFGILYGRGAEAISRATGMTLEEAKELKEGFLDAVPRVKAWIESQHEFVKNHEFIVSRMGRVRYLIDDLRSRDEARQSHALRCAVNTPIQGLGSDICLDSASRIYRRFESLGLRSVVFGIVHDSILLDVSGSELLTVLSIVSEEMRDKLPSIFPWLNIPLDIDIPIGTNRKDTMTVVRHDRSGVVLDGSIHNLGPLIEVMKRSHDVTPINIETSKDDSDKKVRATLLLRGKTEKNI